MNDRLEWCQYGSGSGMDAWSVDLGTGQWELTMRKRPRFAGVFAPDTLLSFRALASRILPEDAHATGLNTSSSGPQELRVTLGGALLVIDGEEGASFSDRPEALSRAVFEAMTLQADIR